MTPPLEVSDGEGKEEGSSKDGKEGRRQEGREEEITPRTSRLKATLHWRTQISAGQMAFQEGTTNTLVFVVPFVFVLFQP